VRVPGFGRDLRLYFEVLWFRVSERWWISSDCSNRPRRIDELSGIFQRAVTSRREFRLRWRFWLDYRPFHCVRFSCDWEPIGIQMRYVKWVVTVVDFVISKLYGLYHVEISRGIKEGWGDDDFDRSESDSTPKFSTPLKTTNFLPFYHLVLWPQPRGQNSPKN